MSAAEGTTLTFTIHLSAPSPRAVLVHYASADDTAAAPSDYTAAAGDLELAPGQTAAAISIAVNGDNAVEADERFRLNLSNPRAARIADPQGIGTITNDDVAVSPSSPPPVRAASQELPPPEAGEEVNALPKSGTVRVKLAARTASSSSRRVNRSRSGRWLTPPRAGSRSWPRAVRVQISTTGFSG